MKGPQKAHSLFCGDEGGDEGGDILLDTSFACRRHKSIMGQLTNESDILFVAKEVDTLIDSFEHLRRSAGYAPRFTLTSATGSPLSIAALTM